MDTGVIEGGLNVTLTIRLLMHGKVRVPGPLCRALAWHGLGWELQCLWDLLELPWGQECAAGAWADPEVQPAKKIIIVGCGGTT